MQIRFVMQLRRDKRGPIGVAGVAMSLTGARVTRRRRHRGAQRHVCSDFDSILRNGTYGWTRSANGPRAGWGGGGRQWRNAVIPLRSMKDSSPRRRPASETPDRKKNPRSCRQSHNRHTHEHTLGHTHLHTHTHTQLSCWIKKRAFFWLFCCVLRFVFSEKIDLSLLFRSTFCSIPPLPVGAVSAAEKKYSAVATSRPDVRPLASSPRLWLRGWSPISSLRPPPRPRFPSHGSSSQNFQPPSSPFGRKRAKHPP